MYDQKQQLHTPCDEETAAVLNDCYMLEEKERLKEEWIAFEEQRKNFEMERRRFTEAAIRLGHEVSLINVCLTLHPTFVLHQFEVYLALYLFTHSLTQF